MPAQLLLELGWQSSRKDIPAHLPQLINTDSRSIRAGQWFAPIVGERFDGHQFIEEALKKGAVGFFYDKDHKELLSESLKDLGIEVGDTTAALQALAHWWRQQQTALSVIAITGSSGKTSVKELLFAMLDSISPTLKTEGSLNNELGVPLTLCRLQKDHRYAVIEMGARHKGDVAFLGRIAEQDVGVLLNVGTAHLGEFGSTESILEAKMEIARASSCVYLRDDERIHRSMQALGSKRFTTFGRHPEADVCIIESKLGESGQTHLSMRIKGEACTIDLPYYHDSYAINVATVLAVGQNLGLPLNQCLQGLKKFRGVKGRYQIHQLPELTLIDDAYNANPQSMRAGLETICLAYSSSSKILVLGDMNELGDSSEAEHRAIGLFCARQVRPKRLITVGRMSHWIAESARQEGMKADQVVSFEKVDDLLPQLDLLCRDAQLLYVKASNSLRLNKIIDTFLSR